MWDNQLTCNFVNIVKKKKQELIIKQESVRKSNRSCKGGLGLNWLERGKIDSTVSEHDNALVRKNNLTTRVFGRFLQCHHQVRVLRLHPHLSPQFLLRKFPWGRRLLQKAKLHEPDISCKGSPNKKMLERATYHARAVQVWIGLTDGLQTCHLKVLQTHQTTKQNW